MLSNFKLHAAFTLAEVVIVLGIIGIIAESTIPSLVADFQKKVQLTGLQKAYSNLNEAFTLMLTNTNCINDFKCTGLFNTGTNDTTMGTEIVKYFKVLKNCQTAALGCMTSSGSWSYKGVGRTSFDSDIYWYRFITTDGMSFAFHNYKNNCADEGYSAHRTNNMTAICAEVYIDINGPQKGPNNAGRDIFGFYLSNGKGAVFYPWGGMDDNADGDNWWTNSSGTIRHCYSGDPNPDISGFFCTGRVVEEGWQMNY